MKSAKQHAQDSLEKNRELHERLAGESLVERLRPHLECTEGDDHLWPREDCEREGKCWNIIQAVKRELQRAEKREAVAARLGALQKAMTNPTAEERARRIVNTLAASLSSDVMTYLWAEIVTEIRQAELAAELVCFRICRDKAPRNPYSTQITGYIEWLNRRIAEIEKELNRG